MRVVNKILQVAYYILWITFLSLLYANFTEKYYLTGRILAPILGILTALIFAIVIISLTVWYYLRKDKLQQYKRVLRIIVLPILGLIPFLIINTIPKHLDDKVHKIEVTYVAYACECANWRMIKDNGTRCKGNKCDDIFLEPKDEKNTLPDTIGFSQDVVEFTGRFYSKKGFPKYYYSEQLPDKARVFQYTSYKVIKSNYREIKYSGTE